MTAPLEGIRVIDLGQVYAAPYCTLQLAAMGAEIIKIEPPGSGEVLRGPGLSSGGVNYAFLMLNANKKSVTVNLKHPRGRDIVLKLLEDADVLVENYREGVMESFELGYGQLAERFPRLIYACGRGYGSDSRWAKVGAMDSTVQASSGFMSITGFPERSVKTSATFIDMGTGSHLVSGILAALFQRERTGRGQKIEVAMLDVAIPALTSALAAVLQNREFQRRGNRHWGTCPTNVYPASDGEVLIFSLTEAHWQKLARLMGREDLIQREEYRSHGARFRVADELDSIIAGWTSGQSRDAIIDLLIENGIPCAPVREVQEVVADPEVTRRGILVESESSTRGRIKVAGSPIKLSTMSGKEIPNRRPPDLGEHTAEVLSALGIGPEELERLRSDGAV